MNGVTAGDSGRRDVIGNVTEELNPRHERFKGSDWMNSRGWQRKPWGEGVNFKGQKTISGADETQKQEAANNRKCI